MAPELFYVNLIFLSTQPKMHTTVLQMNLRSHLFPNPCENLLCTAAAASSSIYLSISHANGAVLIGEVLMPEWVYQ